MIKKELKKEHFEVLLEEIRSDVKLALEGHQGLNRKLDEVKSELGEQIDVVRIGLQGVKTDLQGVKADLRNVERNLGKKIDDVKTALDYHIKLPVH